jgi:Flp pilus assembly CpaE family ATPase
VYGFMGAKGGVGVTTVACHFALELRRQTNERVLLADLEPAYASPAFLLKLESKYSIFDAVANLQRLDEAFWNSLVAATPSGLEVLSAPISKRGVAPANPQRVRHGLRFARSLYHSVVLDLGRTAQLPALLEETSELFLVSTASLPEMFAATNIVRDLLEVGVPGRRLHLLFNRVPKYGGAALEALERAVGQEAAASLNDCSREIEEAQATGRFVEESLTLRKQISQLVARCLGTAEKPAARGLLGMFKLARGAAAG